MRPELRRHSRGRRSRSTERLTLLVDTPRSHKGSPRGAARWSHLVSDTSLAELHAFAAQLGLHPTWFQPYGRLPHYDITEAKWRKARQLGAQLVSYGEIARRGVRS